MAIKIYKKHWLVLVAIALVALSVILLPQRLDEDKLQDLWEQGNYPAVAYGAEEILRRDNTAHEVREMAVQAYLATEQCLPALEHLLVLAEANWPISPGITREIVNSIDEMGEESVQELVVSLSQLLVHLGEPRAAELGIDLVTRPSLAELVPEFVEHLSVLRDNDPTGILFFRAWDNVLNNGSLEAMWRTAEIINEEIMFLGQSRVFQSDVLSQGVVQEQEWRSLQGQRPDEPLVALGLAGSMEGRDGLAWLLDWEEGKDVPPELADIYSHFKLDMLVQKDAIESSNLAWITPEDIGYLAYSSQGEMREELFNLAQELESSSQFQQHGEIIRLVQESEPNLVAENVEYAKQLTRDGWLVYTHTGQANEMYREKYLNLNHGTSFSMNFTTEGNSYWSPDMSAWFIVESSGKITVLDSQGAKIQDIVPEPPVYQVLGQKDAESLFVHEREGHYDYISVLNIEDGRVERIVEFLPSESVSAGSGGKLAWTEIDTLTIRYDNETHNFSYGALYIDQCCWNPDGSAVALRVDGQPVVQYLSGETVNLGLNASCLGWRSSDELYLSLQDSFRSPMLAIYNLEANTMTSTGIYGASLAEGAWAVTWEQGQKLFIHELP